MNTRPDPCPAGSTKDHAKKPSPPNKGGRQVLLFGLFALLAAAIGFTAANFPKIKNALFLRFASPQAYMAYIEANYFRAQGKKWQAEQQALSSLFENRNLSGARVDLHINHLLTSLLPKEGTSTKKPDLSGISLLFLAAEEKELSLFQFLAQVGGSPLASLDFLTDAAAEQIYISCPQAGDTALVVSTAKDDPIVMLLQSLGRLLQAFRASIYDTVSADPYSYLFPYLDVITEVTMDRDVPLPVSDADLTGIRLNMLLSLDTALDIAAKQLDGLKNAPGVTDPLLPCYELSVGLLRYLAEHDSADLGITAYVDDDGKVLGHEFYILSGDDVLLSLTGILTPSPAGGKSGELTLFSKLGNSPLTILLSVSELGFDAPTGLPTGKINISGDRLSALHFQLLLGSTDHLPKVSLLVRALGGTAASLELTPTDMVPGSFPDPHGYRETYALTQLPSFLKSLDLSGILSDLQDRTGIDLPLLLPALPFSVK